uniref:Putative ribonuclease H-like domain-containing protein n=1 Tax=Tanacetum cinerariifolium TaxID=118510 RepID=A0A699RHH3_TANCI|nr:putative ribonuclease H-like domain-containing protein [Tanacetum cinerariifolium]
MPLLAPMLVVPAGGDAAGAAANVVAGPRPSSAPQDAYEKNLIQVVKIHTDENVTDLLTKAFDGPQFHYLIVHIGMLNP